MVHARSAAIHGSAQLGALVARLHAALATPSDAIADPLATAEPAIVAGWLAHARATFDEAVRLTTQQDPAAARLLVRMAPAIRAELDSLPLDRPIPLQPVHGDLHVGQVLEWSGGLAVIDFDGNPALGADANAIRQPIERDVAQMTSSVDHLGRVVGERTAGRVRGIVDAWIARDASRVSRSPRSRPRAPRRVRGRAGMPRARLRRAIPAALAVRAAGDAARPIRRVTVSEGPSRR